MNMLRKEEKLYGLPDDVSPYAFSILSADTPGHLSWDSLREIILKHKDKSTNFIPFTNRDHFSRTGFILSLLSSNGINQNDPPEKLFSNKDAWLEAYQWMHSIDLNWELFFQDNSLSWLLLRNKFLPLSVGWLKSPPEQNPDQPTQNYLSFPKGPSASEKVIKCFQATCWASCLNNVPREILIRTYKRLHQYSFIEQLELQSNSYFNAHQDIWTSPKVLEKKALYSEVKELLHCDVAVHIHQNSQNIGAILSSFRAGLQNKTPPSEWFDLLTQNISPREQTPKNSSLQLALKYVNENYTKIESVKDIALHIDKSYTYTKKIFQDHYHISCWQFIIQTRINQAKHLLQHTETPIKQIYSLVGFKNYTTFARAFKKVENTSPLKFRKNNK